MILDSGSIIKNPPIYDVDVGDYFAVFINKLTSVFQKNCWTFVLIELISC